MRYMFGLLLAVAAITPARLAAQPTNYPTAATSVHVSGDGSPAPVIRERNPLYRLRKGDSFDADFALSPDFNQSVTIQPDGYVTLKGAGSVHVEGLTVPETAERLKQAYAFILHQPVISIVLKDFEKPYFIASGQVTKPGKYDLRSELTLTEAVAIAGGFNDKAKHSQVVLFRRDGDGMYRARLLDVKKMLATRDLAEDVALQPGDVLYVPQSVMSRIRPYLPTTSVGAYINAPIF